MANKPDTASSRKEVAARDARQAPPLTAKAVRERLNQLPVGEPDRAIDGLLRVLDDLRRRGLKGSEFLDVLDEARELTRGLSGELWRRIETRWLPLNARHQALASQMQRANTLLIACYRRALRDIGEVVGGLLPRRKRLQARAVAGLADGVEDALITACRLYYADTGRLWQQLHKLFDYTRRAKLEATGWSRHKQGLDWTLLSHRYKRLLLLGIGGPAGIPAPVLKDLYGRIGTLAGRCQLLADTGAEIELPDGVFRIDVDCWAPVRTGHGLIPTPENSWLLDTRPIVDALNVPADDAPKPTADGFLRPADAVFLRWSAALSHAMDHDVDRAKRVAARGRAFAVVGLENVVRLLGPPQMTKGREVATDALFSQAREVTPRASDTAVPWLQEESAAARGSGRVLALEFEDCSDRGCRFRVAEAAARLLGVGSVIAFHREEAETAAEEWELGLVRWARVSDIGGVETGLEVLGRVGSPVDVELFREDGVWMDTRNGFLLLRGDDPSEWLVLDSPLDKRTVELGLTAGDRCWRAYPEEGWLPGDSLPIYHLRPVEGSEESNVAAGTDSTAAFDDIWDDL